MAVAPQTPVSRWYAEAVSAMHRRDFSTTARLAEAILASAPGTPDVHHLLGVAQAHLGDLPRAAGNYEEALRGRPDDPTICNNYASLLNRAGDYERALSLYRRAVAKAPSFLDALVGVGLVARRLGYFSEAEAALERAVKLRPDGASIHQALGLLHLGLGKLDQAASAFARAAQLAPRDLLIALSQAQVEIDRGGDAAPLYDRAASIAPHHPDVVLGKARVAVEENDPSRAAALIEDQLRRSPDWLGGYYALSKLRWQSGEGAAATRAYEVAILARPDDFNLRYSYITTLHSMERYSDALGAILDTRAHFSSSQAELKLLDELQAMAASETGDLQLASELFERSQPEQQSLAFRVAYIRHLLRARRPDEAARLAENLANETDHGAAWAYLGTAWRLLGDSRYEWLEGDSRLVSVTDLDEVLPHLNELAETIRRLHIGKAHPFEQSLRGGTQTEGGGLLVRRDPELQRLRAAFERAVSAYIAQLPPPDPGHPTLSQPRGAFRFVGSWSVRLMGQGFHIAHVHPQGWLSSAFYVALPPSMGAGDENAGWLTLGQPPQELGLDVPPRRLIEPKPGRLVIFPSHMWHGTVPFEAGERLTAAFDVAPIKDAPPA